MANGDFDNDDVRSEPESIGFELGTPSDYERPTSASSSARELSLTQLCVLFDKSDTTVRSWIEKEKFPYIQRADKKTGRVWIFDSAASIKWYADRAAKLAVERVGVSEDGVISADEAKRRRLVALAISSELDTGEKLKEFVRVSVALRRFEHEAAKIRAALQNLPNAIVGHLPPSIRDLVKSKITDAVGKVLNSFKVSLENDGEADQ